MTYQHEITDVSVEMKHLLECKESFQEEPPPLDPNAVNSSIYPYTPCTNDININNKSYEVDINNTNISIPNDGLADYLPNFPENDSGYLLNNQSECNSQIQHSTNETECLLDNQNNHHSIDVLNGNITLNDNQQTNTDYISTISDNYIRVDHEESTVYNYFHSSELIQPKWSSNSNCDNFSQSTNSSDVYDNTEYMDTVSSVDSDKYLISINSVKSEECSSTNHLTCDVIKETKSSIPTDSGCNFEVLTTVDQRTVDALPIKLLTKSNSLWHLDRNQTAPSFPFKNINIDQVIRSVPNMSKLLVPSQFGALSQKEETSSKPLLYSGIGAIEQYDTSVTPEEEEVIKKILTKESVIKSDKHMKSLLALSIALAFMNIAIGSVRNLQSSINHEGGVGMIALTSSCVMFMVTSLFSSLIVQYNQPKKCFLYSLIPQLLYIICNIYPNVWLLGVSSGLQGCSLAILWNAMSTYVTFLARGHAVRKNEEFESVSSRYFGITCFFWQTSMIFGNLIASLVLMFGKDSTNAILSDAWSIGNYSDVANTPIYTEHELIQNISALNLNESLQLNLCGAAHCHYYNTSSSEAPVSELAIYLLFGVYSSFVILAIAITALFLEPLNRKLLASPALTPRVVISQLQSVFKFLITPQFLLLMPLFLYSTLEVGFVTADIVMAFVTCPLGVYMVGYTMICLGVCASISSYLSSYLSNLVGRTALLCFGATINLSLLVFMSVWKPNTQSIYVYFILMGGWGLADGIWMSQTTSLVAVLFPDHYEEGYTGLRIIQGLGITVSFGYARSFCMMSKIYITASVCVIALFGYFLSEILRKRKLSNSKEVEINAC